MENIRTQNNQLKNRLDSELESFNEQKNLLNTQLQELDSKLKDLEAQNETLNEKITSESQAKANFFVCRDYFFKFYL